MRKPHPDPAAVAAHIDAAAEPGRTRLRALADVVRAEAPGAVERIAYGLATWHQGENLIHLGAFTNHVGVYPGAAAIVAFADDLAGFKTSKGAIQVPHDAPLPTDLVRRITRWRIEQVAAKPSKGTAKRRAGVVVDAVADDIAGYNAAQTDTHRATCDALAGCIARGIPGGQGKVWHGHPVWFLEGNPIVGYSTHKADTRLLFWSGQSFDDPGLTPTGKFKAAEARYAGAGDIDEKLLRRWLDKATVVQWDYKNLAKNKGALRRLR